MNFYSLTKAAGSVAISSGMMAFHDAAQHVSKARLIVSELNNIYIMISFNIGGIISIPHLEMSLNHLWQDEFSSCIASFLVWWFRFRMLSNRISLFEKFC